MLQHLAKWMATHVPVIEAKWLFSWNKWDGFATPFCIVVEDRYSSTVLHEQAHVYQWWRGWLIWFALLYIGETVDHGYKHNAFEELARSYQHGYIDLEDTWA